MKICPHCTKENYRYEDNCERCHQSIQNISHATFDFHEFFIKTLKTKYLVCFSLLTASIFINPSNILLQAIRLVIISAVVIVLLYLFWEAYLIDNPHKKNRHFTGQLLIFYVVNGAVIIGIIVYESLPDLKGITTLPGLLLYIALFSSILFFMSEAGHNKKQAMSWIFVGFMWFFEVFLIAFFSIFILAKYNLDSLSAVWYWTTLMAFSLVFLFLGLMGGYVVGFSLLNIQDCTHGFLTYFDFLFGESVSLENSILRFMFYSAIFIAFVAGPIMQQILLAP